MKWGIGGIGCLVVLILVAAVFGLWGIGSYNIGAGMARVQTAAAFIKVAMPQTAPGTLTDQEAYDLATYINTRPRPDFAGKELDWPKGDPPPDVAYPVKSKKP